MTKVRWTLAAADDFENAVSHIQQDNPEAARRVATEIRRRIEELRTFPNRGRPGREQGTRELALSPLPYIVVYRVRSDAVQILHLYHGAQDWGRS